METSVLLEVDPNSVVAGWIPVVLVLILAAVCVGIFFSMRAQMRRINVPEEGVDLSADEHDDTQPDDTQPDDTQPRVGR